MMNLKGFICLMCLISMISCNVEKKRESLYFLYYGDRTLTFYDLLLKSEDGSYSPNFMTVGEPITIMVDSDEIDHVIKNADDFNFNNRRSNRGILLISFEEKQECARFLFTKGTGFSELKRRIKSTNIKNQDKNRIIGWIDGLELNRE